MTVLQIVLTASQQRLTAMLVIQITIYMARHALVPAQPDTIQMIMMFAKRVQLSVFHACQQQLALNV